MDVHNFRTFPNISCSNETTNHPYIFCPCWEIIIERVSYIGPSGTELDTICHLLALLEAYCNL